MLQHTFTVLLQAEDWDFPHRPMTPSRILDKENGSSFSFKSGPVILNRRQRESGSNFKRGYLVKKGNHFVFGDS